MPETADVGDGGSVFATASRAYKRPRLERIHGAVKKHSPPRKRICLGGGRVSGRSRENLITSLLPRVQQQTVAVSSERHLPPSFLRQGTSAPVEVRRYSEIHAETEAAAAQLRTTLATSWDSGFQTDAETQGANLVGLAPTTIRQRDGLEVDVATTTIRQGDGLEVDVAPTTIRQLSDDEVVVAHAAVAQDVSSRPIQASSSTQTGLSMLRSYAFEDTRSGFDDDDF